MVLPNGSTALDMDPPENLRATSSTLPTRTPSGGYKTPGGGILTGNESNSIDRANEVMAAAAESIRKSLILLQRPKSDQPPRRILATDKDRNPWWSMWPASGVPSSAHNQLPARPQSDQPPRRQPSWREVCAKAQKPDGSVPVFGSDRIFQQKRPASQDKSDEERRQVVSQSDPDSNEDGPNFQRRRYRDLAMPEPLRQLPLQVLEVQQCEEEDNGGSNRYGINSMIRYLESVVTQIDTNISNNDIPTKEKLSLFKDRLIRTLHKWIKRNVPREHKVQFARVLLADISKNATTTPENLRQEIMDTINKLHSNQDHLITFFTNNVLGKSLPYQTKTCRQCATGH